METVTLDAAKEDLERLVARAAEGEEIVIQSGGRPIAKITAASEPDGTAPPRKRRISGLWAGRVVIHPNFDDPLPPDEQGAWDGDARLWPDHS